MRNGDCWVYFDVNQLDFPITFVPLCYVLLVFQTVPCGYNIEKLSRKQIFRRDHNFNLDRSVFAPACP